MPVADHTACVAVPSAENERSYKPTIMIETTGLKTHLVAASFKFQLPPTVPMMQNASFPPGLDAPETNWHILYL